MGNSRRIRICVILFFLFSAIQLWGNEIVERHDALLAESYLSYGVQLYNDNHLDGASWFVERSISFLDNYSDAFYLRAMIALTLYDDHILAQADLVRALSLNRWNSFSTLDGRMALSRLLLKKGNPQEAFILLDPFKDIVEMDEPFARLYFEILKALHKTPEAINTAKLMLRKFPGDPQFLEVMLQNDQRIVEETRDRFLRGDPYEMYSRESIRRVIRLNQNENLRQQLFDAYEQKWGEDYFLLIEKFRIAEIDTAVEMLNNLIDNIGSIAKNDIEIIYSISIEKGIAEEFYGVIEGFSGMVTSMEDSKGEPMRKDYFENGIIETTEMKNPYNDLTELSLLFQKGFLVSAAFHGHSSYRFEYAEYPFLKTAEIVRDGRKSEFKLIPYEMAFPAVGEIWNQESGVRSFSLINLPELPDISAIPELETLLQASTKKTDTYIEESPEYVLSEHFQGMESAISYEYSREGNINIERRYVFGVLWEEKQDLTGSGIFEITRRFLDGTPARLEYDGNSDGLPEYIEIYGETDYRMWDLTGDGYMDVREYYRDGVRYREFSTAFDGQFNLEIELEEHEMFQPRLTPMDIMDDED